MQEDSKAHKEELRREAVRARSLVPQLTSEEVKSFSKLFFETVDLEHNQVIGAYWPKDREFDICPLLDELQAQSIPCALPVIDGESRILKFALWHDGMDLVKGKFGICQPVVNEDTMWAEPDVFIVPLLAFDRRGYRLGFGGGFYDSTLAHYREQKDIVAIGVGYAEQACLFNLPTEDHDVRMDYIITPRQSFAFG